ncbi:MAG: enoyl-CoA hydratase/isomerase family protein [Dehalococcoidales bacterium]|nr:enoyl-CoA hydratase/isomerase family protein [Dehalococcoidales bacterium]
MTDQNILYTKENGIGIITLNRPERMNAITPKMLLRMSEITAEIIRDDEVRVVIITGNGRVFCGGTDVGTLGQRDEKLAAENEAMVEKRKMIYENLPPSPLPSWGFTHIPKPTIAAVNGAAVGMGVEWTVQCDFRIASENARFGWVFSRRGLVPDTGAGPYLLPYIVGLSKALELMYSGEIIDAKEAEKIGLVSMVVPPDELMPAAMKLAQKLMKGAPLSLKGIKELTYGSMDFPPNAHSDWTHKLFREANLTEDCREGIKAFVEKRPPVWKGK